MTPRQIFGWLYFLNRYRSRQRAEALATAALGARGDSRKLNSEIKALLKDQ